MPSDEELRLAKEHAWAEGYLAHEENSRTPIGVRRKNPYSNVGPSSSPRSSGQSLPAADNYVGPYGVGVSQYDR